MKVFKISLGLIVGLVLLLLLGSLWLPSQWQVERSIRIKAAPAEVFPYFNNLTKWPEWTAWYQREPQPVTRYSGPEAGVGVGAMSEWQDASGQGAMAITVSVPDWGMTYNLSFEHGEFTAHGEILLAPVADGTHVTWRMRGETGMNPVAKYFAVLMDYRIGADFEQSLTNLKRKLETKG